MGGVVVVAVMEEIVVPTGRGGAPGLAGQAVA